MGPRDVEKDYYAALGVAKDADAAAIKKFLQQDGIKAKLF